MPKDYLSHSEDETAVIAREVADALPNPCIICLYGDLGAGKTAFSRAFIRQLVGNEQENVPSPTYTLVQTYKIPSPSSSLGVTQGSRTTGGEIWHFDLYRLDHPDQLYDIGWEEALTADYCLIEWPERLGNMKPQNSVDITIESLPDGSRRFILNP